MDLIAAPRVRARAKSRWHPSAIDASIARAAWASRFNPGVMTALHDGEVVALVRGEHTGARAAVTPVSARQWCSFNTYADLDAAARNGQQFRVVFSKPSTSVTTMNDWWDTWPTAGLPGAGDYSGAAATLRAFDNTIAGSVQCSVTPGAGQTRHFSGWGMGHPNSAGAIARHYILYDRVAAYDGCTVTLVPTTLTNTAAPARYVAAGQDGLLISVTCVTAGAGTASALSAMTVTDQQGNTGVALAPGWTLNWNPTSVTASATTPSHVCLPYDTTNLWTQCPWLPLPANVSGVRKVEAFTSTAINLTQVVCIGLIKPLGSLWCGGSGVHTAVELARSMFALERVYSDACMAMLFSQGSSNTADILADLRLVHG